MTEKEVFYPAEEYYKKQNNCEFYLVKTDYKLLMIDDIVRILNNQRETIQYHRKTEKQLEKEHTRLTNQLRLSYDKVNKLTDENEQLKIKLKDITLEMENAKESNDDAQYELYKLKKENEQLKQFLKSNCPMCGANLELFYEEMKGDVE